MDSWEPLVNVHSPTGSEDSGVGLSPRSYNCGPHDDIFTPHLLPLKCSESHSNSVVCDVIEEGAETMYALTCDELNELERISNGCISQTEGGSMKDITNISLLDLNLDSEYDTHVAIHLLKGNTDGEPSEKRKRYQSKCEEVGRVQDTDRCFIPKSGTGKPRQSHKKRKPLMETDRVMKRRVQSGARVKKTARERLQEIRVKKTFPENHSPTSAGQYFKNARIEMQLSVKALLNAGSTQLYNEAQNNVMEDLKPRSTTDGILPPLDNSLGFQLFESQQDTLDELLASFVESGNSSKLKCYLLHAASSARSPCEQTPFHSFVNKLNQKMHQFSVPQMKNITDLLCRVMPLYVNAKDLKGETPLYRASLFGNVGSVLALLESNADPCIRETSGGETALHAAIRSKSIETTEIIIENIRGKPFHFEKINITGCGGNTSLHKAAALRDINPQKQRRMILSLLAAEADPSRKNNMNEMAHSLLPPSLRDIQDEMKKRNARKRSGIFSNQPPLLPNSLLTAPHIQQSCRSCFQPPVLFTQEPNISNVYPQVGFPFFHNPMEQCSISSTNPAVSNMGALPALSVDENIQYCNLDEFVLDAVTSSPGSG